LDESFGLPGDHQVFDILAVNFVCDFPLSELKGKVPYKHESQVDQECDYWQGRADTRRLLSSLQIEENQNYG
jgi:hypothetical protein